MNIEPPTYPEHVADRYHAFVEWSDEDALYIGHCPDLFIGGACHGDDAVKVYAEVRELVEQDVNDRLVAGRPLPPAKTRPSATA